MRGKRDIQTSGFLAEFAEQLHGLSFTEEQRGEESKVRVYNCFLNGATVKLDRGLQCIQGLSAPPGLPLHIHNVWLQLHHLLLQLTHPRLDTHMGNFKSAHTDSHVKTQ